MTDERPSDILIRAIREQANYLRIYAEAELNDNERWVIGHVIDRFIGKRGFKTTSSIDVKAAVAIEKMVVAGYIVAEGKAHNYLWTEKFVEAMRADR